MTARHARALAIVIGARSPLDPDDTDPATPDPALAAWDADADARQARANARTRALRQHPDRDPWSATAPVCEDCGAPATVEQRQYRHGADRWVPLCDRHTNPIAATRPITH